MQKVEVKASTDSYNPRKDDTATKIVVTREEILKYGDTNVQDVLKRLPGITVTGRGGRGASIMMRGLGSGYTQILVDGDRPPAGFSLDDLAPDAIERIEIVRAATAEFSTQSIAGTVNIVLKRAIRKAQRELKLSAEGGGSRRFSPTATLQMSDKIGKLGYSVNVNAHRFSSFNDNVSLEETSAPNGVLEQRIERNTSSLFSFEGLTVSPRLTYTLANGDTLSSQSSINVGVFNNNFTTLATIPVGAPIDHPFLSGQARSPTRSFSTDLNWVHAFSGGAKIDVRVAGQGRRGRSENDQFGRASRQGVLSLSDVSQMRSRQSGYSTKGKFSAPVTAGHSLVAGWDLGVTDSMNERRQLRIDLVNPQFYQPYERTTGQVTRSAAYAQDEWNVTPAWSVYAGLRWEGIVTEIAGNTFRDSRSRSSVWSPVFQTLYKLPSTKGDQLRFALTRTYKAPSVGSLTPYLFLSSNNSELSPDRVGNPELGPETAIGFDTSYEHYWSEGALFSISGTLREISGYTRSNVFLRADGRWIGQEINDGKAHVRGLELEWKFPMKAMMSNAPDMDVRVNLGRNWSKVDAVPGPDNRLAAQVPLSGTVGVDYRKGPMTLGASATYRKNGDTRQSPSQRSTDPSFLVADAYLLWKFSPKLQTRLAINNFLPKDMESTSEFVSESGTVRSRQFIDDSATARVSLEWKF